MTQLYTTYADLYHKMYQSFIDYEEEYQYYKALLDKEGCRKILEVGCGTGQLARRFLKDGFSYTGIDVSATMLEFARAEMPPVLFQQMDMREINLPGTFDAVIITARSLSYILTNSDILSTFRSIKKVLKKGGALIFDFIDATSFIPSIKEGEVVKHEVTIDNVKYIRESTFEKRIDTSWNWMWRSAFFKEENGRYVELGTDSAELRTFTADELTIFLALSGFSIAQVLERKTYAFDTKVILGRS